MLVRHSHPTAFSVMSILRTSARPVAALLLALVAGTPATRAAAQPVQNRGWTFCFGSAIGSCSSFFLTTTAVFSSTGSRLGTEVAVRARHVNVNGVVSGLSGFTFFGGVQDGVSDASSTLLTPEAVNGAPEIPTGEENRWLGFGRSNPLSRPDPAEHWYTFNGGFDPAQSQFIGGCLGGVFDASYTSSATTCGDQAYQMGFFSAVHLDANDILELAVDVYAGDGNGDFLPDQASCRASTDGTTGYGIDLGDASFTATCVVTDAMVPEPSSALLLIAALAVGAAVVARRRLAGAVLATSLTACAGADHTVAPELATEASPIAVVAPATVAVSPELLAVVTDAADRVLPTFDHATRAHLAPALDELRLALEAGDGRRIAAALDTLSARIRTDAPTAEQVEMADAAAAAAADFSALTLLVDAIRDARLAAPRH
jgi:hypothetical protein